MWRLRPLTFFALSQPRLARERCRRRRRTGSRICRDFTAGASKLNARWYGDVIHVGTWEGWLYLATVIDIASRRILGYALAYHLRTELVSDALANAAAARSAAPV
jgi:transposase InsO family protein